jgi:GH15 family glucan-1,4-alpha-glucosidase
VYPYGLVGNCQISALVSTQGSVDWLCLPRPDSPPVFGKILDPEGGQFFISASVPPSETDTTQRYLPNTNILVTTVSLPNGEIISGANDDKSKNISLFNTGNNTSEFRDSSSASITMR